MKWEKLRTYVYSRRRSASEEAAAYTSYVRLRRRILFEVWFPDAHRVELDSVMCEGCGFTCYRPRPSDADIDAKYRFLQTAEGNIGGQKADPKLRALDLERAKRIYRTVTRHTTNSTLDVLDFGGGDGKLLKPFVDRGDRCALVDYNLRPLDGVRKVGDTLDDVPVDARFDVIIASHIIEHLAEPSSTVARLGTLLSDRGVIYGEVPLGVWGGIGIEKDPVTHINFFSAHSFRSLFEHQNMQVLEHGQMVGVYNRRMDVVMVVASKGASERSIAGTHGVDEVRKLLRPTPGMQLAQRWRLRRFPTLYGILRRLGLHG
jgi:hypothetical protein